MADAVCGPSNALQQFKQQTQHDRTLQQDRLVNRHNPVQGFRSANPNAGLLDPEFEAFQAGIPVPELEQFHHGPPQFQQQQQFQEQTQAPTWAADFNRMSLVSPPPTQQNYAPAPTTSNWAQGFQAHIAQNAPRAQNSSPSPYAFQQRARYGMTGFPNTFTQPGYAPALVAQGKGKEPMTEQFDEAAFERAFDMAKEDMMVDEVPTQAMNDNQLKTEEIVDLIDQSKEAHSSDRRRQDREEIFRAHVKPQNGLVSEILQGQEVQQETQEQQEDRGEDDDALAATAQELLSKVENNQTDKFKNSQFLTLMRKLRDREVKVRGDQMVETTAAASNSTEAPLNAPLSNPPQFNNSEQRPAPLDTRPPDYGIPSHEQDHDLGRINPADGSDVAALLSQPGLPGGEPDPTPVGTGEDLGTSEPSFSYARASTGDPISQNSSISEMLYGPNGSLA